MTKNDSIKIEGDHEIYARWRDARLAAYQGGDFFPVVELADPGRPSAVEMARLKDVLGHYNMVLYASEPTSLEKAKLDLRSLGSRLGLERLDANLCADEDAITPLAVSEGSKRRRYIPYTNRSISWHTDGYYNPTDR